MNVCVVSFIIALCQSQKVLEHHFGHFRTSEQHADGTKRLALYDFLLVFCGDLRSSWNRSVVSRQSHQTVVPKMHNDATKYRGYEPMSLNAADRLKTGTVWRTSNNNNKGRNLSTLPFLLTTFSNRLHQRPLAH